jgi:hypothetical protein
LGVARRSLVLAVDCFVLHGGLDYPGLFADFGGATDPGPARDEAIEAWEDRYFDVGLAFSAAAAAATVGWLLALGGPLLRVLVALYAAVSEQARFVVFSGGTFG